MHFVHLSMGALYNVYLNKNGTYEIYNMIATINIRYIVLCGRNVRRATAAKPVEQIFYNWHFIVSVQHNDSNKF